MHDISYSLATYDELGYRYLSDFHNMMVFIGRDNSIIGYLDKLATFKEMDIMLKRTLASFHGIFLRKPKDLVMLNNDLTVIDLRNYFYRENYDNLEISVKFHDNYLIADTEISGTDLKLYRTSIRGISNLIISAKLPDREIFVQTEITLINPSETWEDFEIANLEDSQFNWIHSGDAKWFITDEESFMNDRSLRSGRIGTNSKTSVSLEMDLAEPGVLVFAYKTSSRPYYNKLNFYIDGLNMSENESPYLWSGENDWRLVSHNIRRGPRTFKWEYEKSPYDPLYNQDRVWIDMVILPDKLNETFEYIHDKNIILSAYPNPFNPSTEISFAFNENYQTELLIFDIKGRLVAEVFKGQLDKGIHSFEFEGSGLSSGIYYSVLRYGNEFVTRKLILAK